MYGQMLPPGLVLGSFAELPRSPTKPPNMWAQVPPILKVLCCSAETWSPVFLCSWDENSIVHNMMKILKKPWKFTVRKKFKNLIVNFFYQVVIRFLSTKFKLVQHIFLKRNGRKHFLLNKYYLAILKLPHTKNAKNVPDTWCGEYLSTVKNQRKWASIYRRLDVKGIKT